MRDIDGLWLGPLDRVAIVQRDGSRVKVTIGQIEVVDRQRNILGVRRQSVNGQRVSARWARELKECAPSQCVKVFDQNRRER